MKEIVLCDVQQVIRLHDLTDNIRLPAANGQQPLEQ